MPLSARLGAIMSHRADSRRIGAYRAMVGAAALLKLGLVAPTAWRIAQGATARVPFLDALPAFSPHLAAGVGGAWFLAAAALLAGRFTRTAAAVLSGTIAVTIASDQQLYSNHLYLLGCIAFLLCLAGGANTDTRRGTATTAATVPGWPVALIKLQISVVYFFAAATKLNAGFLSGGMLYAQLGYGLVPFPAPLKSYHLLAPMAMGAVLAEFFIAVGLWSDRLRSAAVTAGIGLHIFIVLLLPTPADLLVFAMIMTGSYTLFVSGNRVRTESGRLGGILPDQIRRRPAAQSEPETER